VRFTVAMHPILAVALVMCAFFFFQLRAPSGTGGSKGSGHEPGRDHLTPTPSTFEFHVFDKYEYATYIHVHVRRCTDAYV
jgi:hypothetical protein